MKKGFVFLMSVLLTFTCAVPAANGAESAYPRKTEDILVRDPFILVYDGSYYMYGTGLSWPGYGCVVSEDLENWSESVSVFTPLEEFDVEGDWWAPECHLYKGRFYLFATYRSRTTGFRGTAVFVADSPLGPFTQLSDGHVTPKTRDCIDGTLFVDEKGQPWIVYVGEWTSNADGVGEMYAACLSDDLSEIVSEPVLLFRATDASAGTITDGPFIYQSFSGKLFMLWSTVSSSGYSIMLASTSSAKPDGKWKHALYPLYEKNSVNKEDGGHGMIFRDLDGNLILAFHSPNDSREGVHEHAVFYSLSDFGSCLKTAKRGSLLAKLQRFFSKQLETIYRCRDLLKRR